MSRSLFYFAKISINRAPNVFLNSAKSSYQDNQNKILSQILNKANKNELNWKK